MAVITTGSVPKALDPGGKGGKPSAKKRKAAPSGSVKRKGNAKDAAASKANNKSR